MKLAVVGDIHGDDLRLRRMLEALDPLDRHIIFVGDYINGEPGARAVIDTLLTRERERPGRQTFLLGNHDVELLNYVDGAPLDRLAAMGGVATLHSYLGAVAGDVRAAFRRTLPASHVRFFRALKPCWETEETLISHCGYDPAQREARTIAAVVMGGHPDIFDDTEPPRPTIVFGHYVQRGGVPYVRGALICIDTGCGVANGPLTAALLPERTFVRV